MKSLDFILGVWGSHWRVLNQDVIWVQVQSIFTHAHCFETHYYLRTARTIVLVLRMRKLRLTLIQSLPWAHTITGRAGTIKPTSSDSQSLMQHCFLIFSCEWMNVCISRSCSWYGTHQSQGPKSRLRCILPPRLRLATLLCLPRVFSDQCTCVCVLSLPRWMKKPRCGVPDHPHLSRRRRNKRYALTGQKWRQKHITYRCFDSLSLPPWFWLHPHYFSWLEFQRVLLWMGVRSGWGPGAESLWLCPPCGFQGMLCLQLQVYLVL